MTSSEGVLLLKSTVPQSVLYFSLSDTATQGVWYAAGSCISVPGELEGITGLFYTLKQIFKNAGVSAPN